MLNNHIPISEQNGYGMVQVEYSNEGKLILFVLSLSLYLHCYLFIYYYFFLVLNEFKLQIMNTVSTMKHDLDLITNRVARIEIKLNEVIYIFINRHEKHVNKSLIILK